MEDDILFSMSFEARIKTWVVKWLWFYENRVGTKQFIDYMFCGFTCEDDCVDVILDVFISARNFWAMKKRKKFSLNLNGKSQKLKNKVEVCFCWHRLMTWQFSKPTEIDISLIWEQNQYQRHRKLLTSEF